MSTQARVIVTLQINCLSNWGDDTTISQIKRQAKEDVERELQQIANQFERRVKIVGESKVTLITHDID